MERCGDAPAVDRVTLAALRLAGRSGGGPGGDALADAATVRQPASHRPMRFRTALRLGGSMMGVAAMVTVVE